MTARRTIIGLCAICALFVSAIAAQGASAANGTTAFTCSKTGSAPKFSDPDCETTSTTGEYGHTEIKEGETTKLKGTSPVGKETKLKAKIGGANVTISSPMAENAPVTAAAPQAWMKNVLNPTTKEHFIEGEGTITYTEVTTSNGCLVEDTNGEVGMITTTRLKASTAGAGMGLKFSPKEGNLFAKFKLIGGACPLVGTVVEVDGFVIGKAGNETETMGSAISHFTHEDVTKQKTLTIGEAVGSPLAGIEGELTFSNQDSGTPISATTVT